MSGGSPRLLLGGRDIGSIRHAEWGADAVSTIRVEILAAQFFDQSAHPIDVEAVFPFFAGIEHQRRAPRLLLAPTEGGVAQVSKKRSVSPLIHLLMSPIVMLGIQKRCRTFWGSGASQFNPAL